MPASDDLNLLTEKLKRLFDYDNFFSTSQAEATKAVFQGKKDVYINLEPGGGKSICFQLPAVLKQQKLTLVFVPTNVLAKSQTEFLKSRKFRVRYLHSGMPEDESKNLLNALKNNIFGIQLLYALIDKSTSDTVKEIITKLNDTNRVASVVFDEAQCISKFSPDYLSDYGNVAKAFENVCPNVPKIAVTGTATREVKWDIIKQLGMENPLMFFPPSDNPIVYHDVQFLDTLSEPVEHLRQFLEKAVTTSFKRASEDQNKKCGIIFCRTGDVANTIVRKLNCTNVLAYHGGMSMSKRKSIEARWSAREFIVIATTKKFASSSLPWRNVDFLVHWSPPLSIEQIFHETRRLNKKRRIAYCRVYISCEEEATIMAQFKSALTPSHYDVDRVARQIGHFNEVLNYCFRTKCRHVVQRAYFSQAMKKCEEHCDVCCDPTTYERCAEFLRYRESLKTAIFYPPVINKVEPPDFEIGDATDGGEPLENSRKRLLTTSMKRSFSCDRIEKELVQNYLAARSSTSCQMPEEKMVNMSAEDIRRVAYQLEFSLHIGTSRSSEYHHSLYRKVELIQDCTEAELACGFLLFTESPPIEKLRTPKTEIDIMKHLNIDDDEKPTLAELSDACRRERNYERSPDRKRPRIKN